MLSEKYILSSPYESHYLYLSSIQESNHVKMAKSLRKLASNSNYLDVEYECAFNWAEVFNGLYITDTFYVVVFRSTLAERRSIKHMGADTDLKSLLGQYDKQAHEEGQKSGGLLKYWFGVAQSDGRNLATCVWVNEECATRASKLGAHRRAVELVRFGVYSKWKIERFMLVVNQGQHHFEPLTSPH